MTRAEHTVIRGSVRLSCRDTDGTGRPVVLLPGPAGHAGEWDARTARLCPRHRVVAIDERRPGDVSRAAYVADTATVLEALDLREAVLVGQSLGGHTAMLTAATHPERVDALIPIEAGAAAASPNVQSELSDWLASGPARSPPARQPPFCRSPGRRRPDRTGRAAGPTAVRAAPAGVPRPRRARAVRHASGRGTLSRTFGPVPSTVPPRWRGAADPGSRTQRTPSSSGAGQPVTVSRKRPAARR
ncbi:alpha/beta fold hydrolase [Kitasatospora humi]|uniref:alpha/beta fold hydrolase n=1 Tax=Kitasatospora humi TaxID=2893891 RepID=UPI0027E19967|nr:alpha/beta hydrolase [Kitasatospora humi]